MLDGEPVGRYYANGGVLQSTSQRFRSMLLPSNAVEVDISKCGLTTMRFICDRLVDADVAVDSVMFEQLVNASQTLSTIIEDRDAVIRDLMNSYYDNSANSINPISQAQAKELLQSICYGSGQRYIAEKGWSIRNSTSYQKINMKTPASILRRSEPKIIGSLRATHRALLNATRFPSAWPDLAPATILFKCTENERPSRLALYLQHVESVFTQCMYTVFVDTQVPIYALVHDGIYVDGTQVTERVISTIVQYVKETTSIEIMMRVKRLPDVGDFVTRCCSDDLVIMDTEDTPDVPCEYDPSTFDAYAENLLPLEAASIRSIRDLIDGFMVDNGAHLQETIHCFAEATNLFLYFGKMFAAVMKNFNQIIRRAYLKCQSDIRLAISMLEEHFSTSTMPEELIRILEVGPVSKRVKRNTIDAIASDTSEMHRRLIDALVFCKQNTNYNPEMTVEIPNPDAADFIDPKNRSYERHPHRPRISEFARLCGIDRLVFYYIRVGPDDAVLELAHKPVYRVTQFAEAPVEIVTEISLRTQTGVRMMALNNWAALRLPIDENGKYEHIMHKCFNLFNALNPRASAVVHTIGPQVHQPIADISYGEINTATYPTYAHILGEELRDCVTHTVRRDLHVVLDRLCCHIAGCERCHCIDCVEGITEGCHFCDSHNTECIHLGSAPSCMDNQCTQLKNYVAHAILHPHMKKPLALLLYSRKGGEGKTALMTRMMQMLLGEDLIVTSNSTDVLLGQYNSECKGKSLVVLNDVNVHGSEANSRIVGLVDADRAVFNGKWQRIGSNAWFAGVVICGNHLDRFPDIDASSRKFLGCFSACKGARPGYEETVLGWFHRTVLSAELLPHDDPIRVEWTRNLVAYWMQIPGAVERIHFDDVTPESSFLLRRLLNISSGYRRLAEIVENVLRVVIDYMDTHNNEYLTLAFSNGSATKMTDILTLSTTADQVRSALEGDIKFIDEGVMTTSVAAGTFFIQESSITHIRAGTDTPDYSDVKYEIKECTTKTRRQVLHFCRETLTQGIQHWDRAHNDSSPRHLRMYV